MTLRRRSRLARLACACALVLEVILPGLTTTADASYAAGDLGLGGSSHVESPSDDPCLTGHADDCALCTYRSTRCGRASEPSRLLTVLHTNVVAFRISLGPRTTRTFAWPVPRGPPSLS